MTMTRTGVDVELETETTHQRKRQRQPKIIGSSFEKLEEELVIEILCRIPYKHLMLCKCVSKGLHSLITKSHRYIVARRSSLLSKKQKLQSWTFMYLLSNNVEVTSKESVFQSRGFSLSFLPYYGQRKADHPIQILQTFNDLVLCGIRGHSYGVYAYFICNPLTRQWVALPHAPQFWSFEKPFVNFICESYEEGGLAIGRFKVVRVYRSHENGTPTLHIEMYSSDTGQWEERDVVLLPNKPFPIWETVTCNGNLFVLPFQPHGDQIMVLDLISLFRFKDKHTIRVDSASDSHYYHVLRLPKVRSFGIYTTSTFAYQGRLRVVHLVILEVPILYFWELKGDYSIKTGTFWSLIHQVCFKEMVTNSEWFWDLVKTRLPLKDEEHYLLRVLNFHPQNGNVVYLNLRGRMASYDMRNKALSFDPETLVPKTVHYKTRFFPLVLPSCPTMLPKL